MRKIIGNLFSPPSQTARNNASVRHAKNVLAWPLAISWSEAIRQLAPFRDYYMEHFDSPEKRLAEKNPEPFVVD